MNKHCEICQHGKRVIHPAIYQCQKSKKTVVYNYSCTLWEPRVGDVTDLFSGIFKGNRNGRTI